MPIIDPPYRLDPFQNIVGVGWGGKLFLTSARQEGGTPAPNALAAWSRDGRVWHKWTSVEALPLEQSPGAIAQGAGCMLNYDDGEYQIRRSTDGFLSSNDVVLNIFYNYGPGLLFERPSGAPTGDPSKFYAAGGESDTGNVGVWSSADGLAWLSTILGDEYASIYGLSFANKTLFVGVSRKDDPDPDLHLPTRALLKRSVDGVNWTDAGAPFDGLTQEVPGSGTFQADAWINRVCYGNGKYLCIATVRADPYGIGRLSAAVATSTDGVTWGTPKLIEVAPDGLLNQFLDGGFVDGLFFVGGGWFELGPPTTPPPGGGGWTASTYARIGTVAASPDGDAWTYYRPIPATGSDLNGDDLNWSWFGKIAGANRKIVSNAECFEATGDGLFHARLFLAQKNTDGSLSLAETTPTSFDFNSPGNETIVLTCQAVKISAPSN